MQDPKKSKKKRYRLHDDPIPTDPEEFDAYQRGEYEEEPFLDYWNRKGAAEAVESARIGAESLKKYEAEKKEKERQKALLAAKSARSGKSVGKFASDATRVRGS